MANIGKPKRIIEVEPKPITEPAPAPAEPVKVPEKVPA